jgi:hypothetical protein
LPGKRSGEPCVQMGDGRAAGRELSDCGYLLQCLDLDGRGRRCHAGSRLGERCGLLKDLPGMPSLECIEGFCDIPRFGESGVCNSPKSSGPCSRDDACIPPSLCGEWIPNQPSFCQVPLWPRTLGAACMTNGNAQDCGWLGYRRANARPKDPSVPVPGTCQELKKMGQPCVTDWDRCDRFATCTKWCL